jgi:hypothetical protein
VTGFHTEGGWGTNPTWLEKGGISPHHFAQQSFEIFHKLFTVRHFHPEMLEKHFQLQICIISVMKLKFIEQ